DAVIERAIRVEARELAAGDEVRPAVSSHQSEVSPNHEFPFRQQGDTVDAADAAGETYGERIVHGSVRIQASEAVAGFGVGGAIGAHTLKRSGDEDFPI